MMRKALRQNRNRIKQALDLKRDLHERMIAPTGDDLLGLRDRALLAIGYATLCRRSELVAICIGDFGKAYEDGSVSVPLRRSKCEKAKIESQSCVPAVGGLRRQSSGIYKKLSKSLGRNGVS